MTFIESISKCEMQEKGHTKNTSKAKSASRLSLGGHLEHTEDHCKAYKSSHDNTACDRVHEMFRAC